MPRKRDRILSLFSISKKQSPEHVGPTASASVGQFDPASIKEVAWEGVKTALVLLKENSAWLPQLKAATSGLIALIDALEVTA